MKIALAQLNYHIGNFESNSTKIIKAINEAKQKGADLIVFAELAICGYPPRDFLEFSEFIELCDEAVKQVAAACTDIACILGAPTKNPRTEGKDLFNSAYFIENGIVKNIVNKALLPTYDVFDEYRYFEPATNFFCIDFKGKKIALTICEDLWNINDNPLYISAPMDELIKQQPDLMINIAASPFSYNHDDNRYKVLSDNCKKYNLPLLYVNQIGSQTEIIFDGGSLVFNAQGELLDQLNYFKEDIRIYEFEANTIKNHQKMDYSPAPDIEQIHQAVFAGI